MQLIPAMDTYLGTYLIDATVGIQVLVGSVLGTH